MKALVIGVLAAALAGCSRQPPLADTPPCTIRIFCHTASAMPAASPPVTRDVATTKQAFVVHRPRRHHGHAVRVVSHDVTPVKVATRQVAAAAPASPRAPANVAEPQPAATNARTIQQQVAAAAAVAERMSASDANARSDTKRSESAAADTATAASGNKADGLVVVLLARPDIKSLAELTGKTIAIDGRYSASNGNVRTAIAAAGAPEVQISQGQSLAIDRLVNGETPAAVLALVSASAAGSFPDIAGYRTFQVPLSPHVLKQP